MTLAGGRQLAGRRRPAERRRAGGGDGWPLAAGGGSMNWQCFLASSPLHTSSPSLSPSRQAGSTPPFCSLPLAIPTACSSCRSLKIRLGTPSRRRYSRRRGPTTPNCCSIALLRNSRSSGGSHSGRLAGHRTLYLPCPSPACSRGARCRSASVLDDRMNGDNDAHIDRLVLQYLKKRK